MTAGTARRQGRPRDERLDAAILAAGLEELRDHGFNGLSMEAVAARAGVAKTTVYRRWANSDELAFDALRRYLHDDDHDLTGTGRERVVDLVHRLRRKWNDPVYAAIMRRVAADGSSRPEIYRTFRDRLIAPGVERMNAALARSVDEGELRADTDIELARRMIVAPVIAASMTLRGTTSATEAEAVIDVVYAGLAP